MPLRAKRCNGYRYIAIVALITCLLLSSTYTQAQRVLLAGDSLTVKENDIEFLFVHGGSFVMGSNNLDEEMPAHNVSVRGFYLSKYEITQRIWKTVMGYNESEHLNCDDCPVENVSWNEIQRFIGKLSQKTGKRYRLPSEAEWEFAASGGIYSKHYIYAGSNDADAVAWYWGNGKGKTHAVGQKKPNELGFYDMSGNVAEWCNDWWDYRFYSHSPASNPKGPASGTKKVVRGGNFSIPAPGVTIKCRAVYGQEPDLVGKYYGFRLARDCQ